MRRLLPLLVLAAALVPAPAQAADRTLTVLGRGTARVQPDLATLTVHVNRTAPAAQAARDSVNKRATRVIGAATALGVDRQGIQTSSITLSRRTIRPLRRGGPRRVRYDAAETVTIRTAQLDRVGTLFNAVTAVGATSIDGPSFTFANPSAGRAEAERTAIADARTRADAAAAQLGVTVVGVQSINLDPGSAVVPEPQAATVAPAAGTPAPAPTPVEPGQEDVAARVVVVFILG